MFITSLSGFTFAADDPSSSKFAIVDPDSSDIDLQLQGEYVGENHSGKKPVGMQVVALGSGQFAGQLLNGGLPGDGWDRTAPVKLSGTRAGSQLTLQGGSFFISLLADNHSAAWHDSQSNALLGTFSRVNRVSPTLGQRAPVGAALLFSGDPQSSDPTATGPKVNLTELCWQKAELTEDGLLKEGAKTRYGYQDFKLHVEFRLPFMPNARSQSRGNSGIYLNGRQEVQVLDSFGLDPAYNEAGSLYKYKSPDLNMSYPPLTWQTYDISYQGARFNACGYKTQHVMISVQHNGVTVQDRVVVTGPTGAGAQESPCLLPLTLQDHGDPVVFRNVWIAPLETTVVCTPRKAHRRR